MVLLLAFGMAFCNLAILFWLGRDLMNLNWTRLPSTVCALCCPEGVV